MPTEPLVRPATPQDVPTVLAMIRELAAYEREPDAVLATEELLTAALFGPAPTVFVHLVEHRDAEHRDAEHRDAEHRDAAGPGEVAGMALWFTTFSTWVGRHGLWLEDLYVRPEHRGRGYGRVLLATLARVCVERGYGRLEWTVLDWNTPARGFYASLGAAPLEDWTTWRLHGPELAQLGAPAHNAAGARPSDIR